MVTIISEILQNNDFETIENAAIKLFLDKNNINNIKNKLIINKISKINKSVYKKISNMFDLSTFDSLNKFFESLFNEKEKAENGIVFTPEFISDYIVKNTIENYEDNTKVIDPSCGCGIFLISVTKLLSKNYGVKISDIIKNNIYGIDLDNRNVSRVKILLSLYAIINNEDKEEYEFNLKCCDSLFCDWNLLFSVDKFDYVVGNPPYINNHDLKKDYILSLKKEFKTTNAGTFNTFYAFIEKSNKYISKKGKIGYIVPNNFLHIKSALELRKYIKDNKLLNTIIDFKDNTVFFPILTYNCIMFLSKNNSNFKYAQIEKSNDLPKALNKIKFTKKIITDLDDNSWYLVDNTTINNIKKIESFPNKLDSYIRTGIATLKDSIYVLDGYDEEKKLYYKILGHKKYFIEPEITREYIKVSKYKLNKQIGRIIFPYHIVSGKAVSLTENELLKRYPLAHKYLLKNKATLLERDKGKNISPWFSYGRSQGINMFTKKIIFSTFNDTPKFMVCPSDETLFSNGYCIVNYFWDTRVLLKILNSKIMKYYIENTSYIISGNFKCFQKKYIKNFSIPNLKKEDITNILTLEEEKLESYLSKLYGLHLESL